MNIRLSVAIVSTACAAALSACGAPVGGAAAPAPAPLKVKIGIAPFLAFAPYWIAEDEGYFRQQGIDVEFVDVSQQADSFTGLLAGQIDVFAGNVSSGMFNAIARDAGVKVVSDKGYLDPGVCSNYVMLLRKGAFGGPRPTAAELRGRRVSAQQGRWTDYWLDRYLATFGLSLADLDVNYVPPAARVEALTSGAIEITTDSEPYVTRALDAGHIALDPPANAFLPGSQTTVMMFGPRLLGDNAGAGRRFMVAYLKGVRKYNEGKTAANVTLLDKYTKLGESLIKRMCWAQIRNDGAVNMDSVMDFQNWALGRKLLDRPLTAGQIYDPAFINYANQTLAGK